jgi:hypothetical protein
LQGAPRNSHIQTSKSVRVKSRCIFSKAFRYFLLHLKAHYFVFLLNPKHIQSSGRGDNACTHAVALCLIDAEKDHIQLSISRGQTLCKLCVNGRKCSTRVFLCRTHAHAYGTILAAFGMRRLFVLGRRFDGRTQNLSVVASPSGARGGQYSL